jgi:hypothetical protein
MSGRIFSNTAFACTASNCIKYVTSENPIWGIVGNVYTNCFVNECVIISTNNSINENIYSLYGDNSGNNTYYPSFYANCFVNKTPPLFPNTSTIINKSDKLKKLVNLLNQTYEYKFVIRNSVLYVLQNNICVKKYNI